jgi:hypothetical protein
MPLHHCKHDSGVWFLLTRIGTADVAVATVIPVDGAEYLICMDAFRDGVGLPCNVASTGCTLTDAHARIAEIIGHPVPEIGQ